MQYFISRAILDIDIDCMDIREGIFHLSQAMLWPLHFSQHQDSTGGRQAKFDRVLLRRIWVPITTSRTVLPIILVEERSRWVY